MKYGNLELEREFDILLIMSWTALGAAVLSAIVNTVIDEFTTLQLLPFVLLLIVYVVLDDVNDQRKKHNDRVFYDTFTRYNAMHNLFSLKELRK